MEYFKNPSNQEVYAYDPATQQELINEAIAAGWQNVTGSWPPPPAPPSANENKNTALGLLSATDYTEIPSVSDPSSTPHLLNKADFVAYRDQVRIFAVYPVAGNIDWPVVPVEQWSDPLENLP